MDFLSAKNWKFCLTIFRIICVPINPDLVKQENTFLSIEEKIDSCEIFFRKAILFKWNRLAKKLTKWIFFLIIIFNLSVWIRFVYIENKLSCSFMLFEISYSIRF
jgi:hypothetical protein